MGWSDTLLLAVLARAMEQRMGEFYAQNLANTAWAFIVAGRSDALLFAALAWKAEPRQYGVGVCHGELVGCSAV